MIYVFLSDDPLTLRECISEEQASTLSWDNYFLYICNYLSWYVSLYLYGSSWICCFLYKEYLFESAVVMNAAKRHQLPTTPWLDSVEY